MSGNDFVQPILSRRDVLATGAAATGVLVIGFWMPPRAEAQTATPEGAAWASESAADEVNAWVVVAPDDIVTVRIAQTELGQGVWTSNAMIVAEELQCDWSKVRPQYASANRDAKEMAPAWTLNVMGKGATDPSGGGEPEFGSRDRTGVTGIPDSLYRRMRTNAAASVKDGRYYLQLAGAEARERLLLAAAKTWQVSVAEVSSANSIITHRPTLRTTTYGKMAPLAAQTPHPNPAGIRIKPPSEWKLMGTEQKNLDIPLKVSGKTIYGIDVRLPGMKWAAVKSCPVYGGKVKSFDFARVRKEPGVISAIQFPIPEPKLIRGRIFGGGVAIIADSWYQAKSAIEKMPIEWDVPPAYAKRDTANIKAELLAALNKPGKIAVDTGDCDSAFKSGAKIVEASYSVPYLPRARMEPGNATVLVTDNRVDIWLGDQSPQETRYSASQITGIPEANVYVHLCHLGGGYGRNGNGPQAEQAIYIANRNRGTPIHLLWTREEDFINTTYRSIGVAKLRAALDKDGYPLAMEIRTATDAEAPGANAGFDVAARYFTPNYRFSIHSARFHVPVGTRRGVGAPAQHFYRESFMDELARAAGKDPYMYRRELIARTNLPYKADMIKALDMAAEMSGWGTPLPKGTARAIGLEERGAESGHHATISALVHTVSVSPKGEVRLKRVDVAHDEGFGLVNPLTVKKQIEGQIVWFYNDAMYQECRVADGHMADTNFDTFLLSRMKEDAPEINIRFFKSGHWLDGMAHDRATSIQSGIADAVFQITGKRYRDLPLRNHDLTWT
jgi:isoquinoline 1-oxidoreductase beta subunit